MNYKSPCYGGGHVQRRQNSHRDPPEREAQGSRIPFGVLDHTFAALQDSAEKIPTNILADRLRRLIEWGFVDRARYQDRPPRFEYSLTETGRALEPALIRIMHWGHRVLHGGMLERVRDK